MKACFVGLGSIGKRHLRNMAMICEDRREPLEVHALRSVASPLSNDIASLVSKNCLSKEELDSSYDILVIANPTDLHYHSLAELGGIARTIFVEKPVFDDPGLDIGALGLGNEIVCQVACPLRYTRVLERVKRIVAEESILSVRVICSSYLPDWRPGKDYRQSYSASSARGGGVRIDLIHEWDYLCWLLGFPSEVSSISGHFSSLEIDSDDLAVYIARFPSTLAEIHLDYFGRTPRRSIELMTDSSLVRADVLTGLIEFSDGRELESLHEGPNDKYLREMGHLIDMAHRRAAPTNDLYAARDTLAIACGCDRRGRSWKSC